MIKNYGRVESVPELRELVTKLVTDNRPIGFDIETGYLGDDREKGAVHPETAIVVGISFTNSTDWARYVALAHDDADNMDNLSAAKLFWTLLSTGLGVAHNAGFELRHLSRWFMTYLADDPEYGEQVRRTKGYFPVRSDTQVEAYLMAEYQRFGLKYLTSQMFGHTMTELFELFPDLAKNKRKYLRFNTLELSPQVVDYACEDSVWCLAIHERYYQQVKDRLLYRVEMAIVQMVVPPMEDHGVRYDWAFMRRKADELRDFRDRWNAEIMAELSELAGEPVAINLASPPQVRKILFEKLGFRTSVFTDKTRDLPPDQQVMSTGDIALTKLAQDQPVVKKILQWRNMTKLLGTYLDKYEAQYNYADDGYAHPNHMSAIVVTGRFAVSDPPYQQSPKTYHFDLADARAAHAAGQEPPAGSCFTFNFRDVIIAPPEHYIFGFDLSQAELRAIAGEAQETALLEAFARGEDIHKRTASLMLNIPIEDVTKAQRDIGKTMNFALGYGMGVKSLADRLGVSAEEAQSLMDKYQAGVPAITTWSARQVEKGRRDGYVTSKFGRKLPIWEYQSDKRWIYQKGDRACVNYPIQGAATGDYMKIAMVRAVKAIADNNLSDKIHLVMNIHDALEFYVHRSIDPSVVVKILAPAVVFEVPGWPAMKADWHLARKWGSPTEIEVSADGTIQLGPEAPIELEPSVEIDEDTGEEIYALPELDLDAVRKVALADRPRRVVLTLTDMPTQQGFDGFTELARSTPGDNTLVVRTPEGDFDWPQPCGITPDHLARISVLLGVVQIHYDSADIDPHAVTAGLRL